MINYTHYTSKNEHPEDVIYREKNYISRLQEHIDSVYDTLADNLRLTEKGKDMLFDYIFNSTENDGFEDYLDSYGIEYDDIFSETSRCCGRCCCEKEG